MILQGILERLSDGEFHSGGSLGELLGVSRSAVWKQLQKLEDMSIPVESIKGRGYRVPGGLDLLSRDAIAACLSDSVKSEVARLEVLQVVDSTNRHVMAGLGGVEGSHVCLAEQQTAGRGRRGRDWVSPYGRNIYLSCSYSFEGGAAVLEGLSLAVGVVVVSALSKLGLEGVELKWPNDLLWRGRKLGGVLLEMRGDASGRCDVVVGLGLNVGMPEVASDDITQPWVDIKEIAELSGHCAVNRSQIAGQVVDALLSMLAVYSDQSFSAWRDGWLRLDAFRGKTVRLIAGAREVVGVSCGVDEGGALLLEVGGEVCSFSGGEVSLRLSDSAG